MVYVDGLFHYIVTRLAVLPYKIWRVNTPDGYGVCFKLGSLELLFDRSDINTLFRLEESYYWEVSSDLHEHLTECLEVGVGFSNVLKIDGKEGI